MLIIKYRNDLAYYPFSKQPCKDAIPALAEKRGDTCWICRVIDDSFTSKIKNKK
jgi:hypothetical protein